MSENKFKKKALVTGASRGMGLATAERLIKEGIEVISTGTKTLGYHAKGSSYLQVDFLDKNSIDNFIRIIKNENIDILVNNAGINKIDNFEDISEVDFDQILQVNLKSPMLIAQTLVNHMKKNNWGRIVNVASIFSKLSKAQRASYSASKFALDGLTASMSAELSELNILINTVSPGFINTELTKKILGANEIRNIENTIPLKRLGDPKEIAAFINWLVSEENTYLTGQNLIIDGGFSRV